MSNTPLSRLTESGRELFENCVVFPLHDDEDSVVGMYGRRLVHGEVNHLYLPGPRRSLVNRVAAQGRVVVLCEAIIDALTLSGHGIDDVRQLRREHIEACQRHLLGKKSSNPALSRLICKPCDTCSAF